MPDIRFDELTFTGFGAFERKQRWRLDRDCGLVFVTGQNKVERELEANGVGKSTLFDALTFALYGRTADGGRGPELINADQEPGAGASLALDLRLDGLPAAIRRCIRPNGLWLARHGEAERPVEQVVVDDLLGVGLETWLAGVHHAQGLDSFLDLGATAQLDLFTELLDLTVYSRAADKASRFARDQHDKIADINKDIANRRGQLIILEDQYDDADTRETEYLRKRYQFLAGVDREIRGWEKQIEVENRKLDDIKANMASVDQSEVEEYKTKSAAAAHELAKVSAESYLLRTRRAQLYTALRETLACPTCGRPFDDARESEAHAKKELRHIDDQLIDFDDKIKELQLTSKNAERRFLNASDEIESKLNRMRVRRREIEDSITRADSKLHVLIQRRKELLIETNKFGDDLQMIGGKRDNVIRSIERALYRVQRELARETHLLYWVKGFKDLRLTIVEAALNLLSMEINNTLSQLGLPDYRVSVEAEGITKSGNVKRGMRMAVAVDGVERSIGRLSYGERQRLRIAVRFGMSDVIQNITGVKFNCEFFDEPTSWLSPSGVNALLTLLEDRAKTRQRTIFVADHRSHQWPFADTVTIVKSHRGAELK